MPEAAMTKSEREDLQRLVRQREKVLKSAAKQRSADLLADFENQMGAQYSFDQDEVWRQAIAACEPEIKKAQARVAARCRELGIPAQFAPSLDLEWHHRGYGKRAGEAARRTAHHGEDAHRGD
jgi:recombinational DNA repair ATPase RecF